MKALKVIEIHSKNSVSYIKIQFVLSGLVLSTIVSK